MSTLISLKNSFGVISETYRALQKIKEADKNGKVDYSEKYVDIKELKSEWAQNILCLLNVELKIIGQISESESMLFVGNHISYLDIPLLMSNVSSLSFVAKKEISFWPVFGTAAKKIETVFVEREKGASRGQARQGIREALNKGSRIVIFPSGTTCLSESKSWRRGAFEIAQELGLYVQPFRISYRPLRKVAYIDEDVFVIHLYKLSSFDKIQAEIEFHEPVKITDAAFDCIYWNQWARGRSLV